MKLHRFSCTKYFIYLLLSIEVHRQHVFRTGLQKPVITTVDNMPSMQEDIGFVRIQTRTTICDGVFCRYNSSTLFRVTSAENRQTFSRTLATSPPRDLRERPNEQVIPHLPPHHRP